MPAPAPLPPDFPDPSLVSGEIAQLADDLGRRGLDPHALVVMRGEQTIAQIAWAPYRADQPAQVYSASKTFTAFAIGFLAHEQRLTLDDPIDAFLSLPNPAGLTIRHLLTMSTGHSREQTLAMPLSAQALLTTPPQHQPGHHFAYNSPATATLARVVHAITGEQLTQFLRPRVLDPLSIGDRWWAQLDGVEQGFAGFHLTAQDLAKAAGMLAQGGRWQGRQVLPAAYAGAMVQPWSDTREDRGLEIDNGEPDTADADWARGYGFQLWRSTHGFRLDGAYGQFGIALPRLGLSLGYQGATTDAQAALSTFWEFAHALSQTTDARAQGRAVEASKSLDSWDRRAHLHSSQPAATVSAQIRSDGENSWLLRLADSQGLIAQDVPVHSETWTTAALSAPAPGTKVVIATRGELRPHGGVLIHAIVPTSPHRLIIEQDPDGGVHVGWHTTPLWHPTLEALRLPTSALAMKGTSS